MDLCWKCHQTIWRTTRAALLQNCQLHKHETNYRTFPSGICKRTFPDAPWSSEVRVGSSTIELVNKKLSKHIESIKCKGLKLQADVDHHVSYLEQSCRELERGLLAHLARGSSKFDPERNDDALPILTYIHTQTSLPILAGAHTARCNDGNTTTSASLRWSLASEMDEMDELSVPS